MTLSHCRSPQRACRIQPRDQHQSLTLIPPVFRHLPYGEALERYKVAIRSKTGKATFCGKMQRQLANAILVKDLYRLHKKSKVCHDVLD